MGGSMSSVVISGDTSGAITLAAPAVAGTNTITLPASTGTILTTGSPQVGSVLQVVNATYSTEVTSATTTYADTGLTATITPKFSTSKILVLVGQNGIYRDNLGATYLGARLVRDSTTILNFEGIAAYISVPTSGSTGVGGISCTYLDSPATTSATTYKTQFASGGNVGTMRLQAPAGGQISTSTITLMEIAG